MLTIDRMMSLTPVKGGNMADYGQQKHKRILARRTDGRARRFGHCARYRGSGVLGFHRDEPYGGDRQRTGVRTAPCSIRGRETPYQFLDMRQ